MLGMNSIEANVVDLEGLQAELAEIDENLICNDLHYIERGEQYIRRKMIYEELFPEIKARNVGGHVNNHKSSSVPGAVEDIPSFVDNTAAKAGVSTRVIHEDIQIAKKLTQSAKEAVENADIAKKDALKLARIEPEKQDSVAKKILDSTVKSVADALHEVAVAAGAADPQEASTPPQQSKGWRFSTRNKKSSGI